MKIGVLTSGGDAPGMNAAVRAVVRAGISNGHRVMGIFQGYKGLLENNMEEMTVESVANIIHRGGTMLKTARCPEFKEEEGKAQAVRNINENNLDGLVVIGGDGTLRGAIELAKRGINIMFLPATIDNDMGYTEYTIGFDTAVNTVVDAIANIRETGMAHDKITVLEVMGRDCGDIAMRAGICGGADGILIPEVEPDMDRMMYNLKCGIDRDKKNHIIVRAEGVEMTTNQLMEKIQKFTGEEPRKVILGYLQRGGSPNGLDVYISTLMGVKAIDSLEENQRNLAMGFNGANVTVSSLEEALETKKHTDIGLVQTAYKLI